MLLSRVYPAVMADKTALKIATSRRQQIGQKIDQIRQDKKMEVKELAAAVGLSAPFLSMVLKGKRGMKPETMKAVAKALGVPLTALDNETEPDPHGDLELFIEENREKLTITPRDEWYLRHSSFRAEPWVVMDGVFWERMLKFWREYLADQEHPAKKSK